jgi:hypothetical protein
LSAKLDAEQAYRIKRQSHINDGMTAAAAESHAKPTDEYIRWRKLEGMYDLGEQQIQLLKKFGPFSNRNINALDLCKPKLEVARRLRPLWAGLPAATLLLLAALAGSLLLLTGLRTWLSSLLLTGLPILILLGIIH